jgi:hypothetical protein
MIFSRNLLPAIGLLACAVGAPARGDIVLNTFTAPPADATGGPIGFAFAGNKFVGTTYNGGFYQTDLNGGNVKDFAPTLHLSGPTVEHFVGAAEGYGSFSNRDIYVAEGNSIIHVANDGSSFNTFVSGLNGSVRGIIFDSVGTFNNNMLVTTSSGSIYSVDGGGHATLLASVGQDTEGASIVPLGAGFSKYNGQLLVSSEGSGLVRAISNTGVVTVLNPTAPIAGAEELSVVPLNLGVSKNPLEGLYGANFTVDIQKANADQFMGMLGDVIVTGEFDHLITRMHFNSTTQQFEYSTIGKFPNQPEDGIFVTAAVLGVPEPSSIVLVALGVPMVIGVWSRRRRMRATA